MAEDDLNVAVSDSLHPELLGLTPADSRVQSFPFSPSLSGISHISTPAALQSSTSHTTPPYSSKCANADFVVAKRLEVGLLDMDEPEDRRLAMNLRAVDSQLPKSTTLSPYVL